MAQHRFFDHTGDFGVDVEGETLEHAVAEVARAFLALLTGDPDSVAARDSRPVEVEGIDAVDAVVAFGNELLFLFEVEGFLVSRFEVEAFDGEGICGVAWGETFDAERHPIARPIKAVTHHTATCREHDEGASIRLIFDL
jgi:SHS2 domain-containing protein